MRIQARPLPVELPSLAEVHPVLARLYAARGISDLAQLEYRLGNLLPWQDLKGIEPALALLLTALQEQQRVLVVGDFDVDGATSTALAVRFLRQLGLESVDYLVPDRFRYGYGLTPEIVTVAAERRPDLILTVDNGISSLAGVAAANERGIRVLITDHHLAGAELPAAAAIVNPNQPGDRFASKALPGVGVIFYLMLALRARLRELDWFGTTGRKEPKLAELLDLVALGIVADVVPLDYNNRILVAQGLARVRARQCRPGILALLEVAGRDHARLVASDFGFCVAPRINAAGRLEDMATGIECLLTDDPVRARELAASLDRLNRERRGIEDRMKQEAMALIDRMQLDEARLPVGLCLFDEHWHEGVVGIVASRLKDRLHRPVIAFARSGESDVKGSARSVRGVHIRDVLDAIAARHPGLISRFGGHAMAAGLSLPRAKYEDFRRAFDAEVRQHLGEEELHGTLLSDGRLQAHEFALELAERIRAGGPWGQGFEEPLFDGEFEIVNRRIVGD
ncbi:MAG TPA: single-stranded-DNA-specific exonuclease RecJ, partial [Chromatiales bacterium]|nr:single-stranded-DNA-specific exonuclease RecJ [Chromatiales bacterium]